MKARYHKYVNTAPEKANEYLLSDAQDTSRYVSAQSYTDNVMNVALPSTYPVSYTHLDVYKRQGYSGKGSRYSGCTAVGYAGFRSDNPGERSHFGTGIQ